MASSLPDVDAMATEVVLLVKSALAPVLTRLEAIEQHPPFTQDLHDHLRDTLRALREGLTAVESKAIQASDLGDVRERIVAMETRLAPLSPTVLAELRATVATLEARVQDDSLTKELGTLRERVAVVEVRPLPPGEKGEKGDPGKDGVNGQDGKPGLAYVGVYQDGKQYDIGEIATWAGSTWHCNEPTETKPGDGSKAWTLMVKRGRDGRDGQDAPSMPVVSVGRPR